MKLFKKFIFLFQISFLLYNNIKYSIFFNEFLFEAETEGDYYGLNSIDFIMESEFFNIFLSHYKDNQFIINFHYNDYHKFQIIVFNTVNNMNLKQFIYTPSYLSITTNLKSFIRNILIRPIFNNLSIGYLQLYHFDYNSINNINISDDIKNNLIFYKTGFAFQINNFNNNSIISDCNFFEDQNKSFIESNNILFLKKEIMISYVINPDFSNGSFLLNFLKDNLFFNFGFKYMFNAYEYTVELKNDSSLKNILHHLLEIVLPKITINDLQFFNLKFFFAVNFLINIGFLSISISYQFNFNERYYNFISSLTNLSMYIWIVKNKKNQDETNIKKLLMAQKEHQENKEYKQQLLKVAEHDKDYVL